MEYKRQLNRVLAERRLVEQKLNEQTYELERMKSERQYFDEVMRSITQPNTAKKLNDELLHNEAYCRDAENRMIEYNMRADENREVNNHLHSMHNLMQEDRHMFVAAFRQLDNISKMNKVYTARLISKYWNRQIFTAFQIELEDMERIHDGASAQRDEARRQLHQYDRQMKKNRLRRERYTLDHFWFPSLF